MGFWDGIRNTVHTVGNFFGGLTDSIGDWWNRASGTNSNLALQYYYNQQQAAEQNRLNRENYEWMYKLNLPETQMANYLAAGINPNLAAGMISSGTVSQPLNQMAAQAPDVNAATAAGAKRSDAIKSAIMELGYKAAAMREDIKARKLDNESRTIDNTLKKASFTTEAIRNLASAFQNRAERDRYTSAGEAMIAQFNQFLIDKLVGIPERTEEQSDGTYRMPWFDLIDEIYPDFVKQFKLGYNQNWLEMEIKSAMAEAAKKNADTNESNYDLRKQKYDEVEKPVADQGQVLNAIKVLLQALGLILK